MVDYKEDDIFHNVSSSIKCSQSLNIARSSVTIKSIDCHAGGEPARVIVGGLPDVPGVSMYEKREYMMENLDFIRKLLILEPRGYGNASFFCSVSF